MHSQPDYCCSCCQSFAYAVAAFHDPCQALSFQLHSMGGEQAHQRQPGITTSKAYCVAAAAAFQDIFEHRHNSAQHEERKSTIDHLGPAQAKLTMLQQLPVLQPPQLQLLMTLFEHCHASAQHDDRGRAPKTHGVQHRPSLLCCSCRQRFSLHCSSSFQRDPLIIPQQLCCCLSGLHICLISFMAGLVCCIPPPAWQKVVV